MPTHNDETLHDRYAREHADHMARLAKLPPEQIAEMELDLHNALAEVDRLRAQLPSQGGEAVEVVASIAVDAEGVVRDFTLEPGLDRHPGGYTVTPLMTVAQHQRILAASAGSAEPVAWRVPVREGGKRTSFYTEALPFVPGIGVVVLGDPVPLYTHPADQVAEGVDAQLREAFPLFDETGLSEAEHHCEWNILQERKRLHAVLDALSVSGKGVKL